VQCAQGSFALGIELLRIAVDMLMICLPICTPASVMVQVNEAPSALTFHRTPVSVSFQFQHSCGQAALGFIRHKKRVDSDQSNIVLAHYFSFVLVGPNQRICAGGAADPQNLEKEHSANRA